MDRTVTVWGKPYAVQVTQKSRISWTASGPYHGETLRGSGQTASEALARWAAAAKTNTRNRA